MSTVFPTPSFSLRREEFLLILHVMNHKRPRLFHLLVVTICVVRFKLLSLTRFFPALSLPWVALRAAAFQPAVRARVARFALPFLLPVRAPLYPGHIFPATASSRASRAPCALFYLRSVCCVRREARFAREETETSPLLPSWNVRRCLPFSQNRDFASSAERVKKLTLRSASAVIGI